MIRRFADLGLEVAITELDVRLYEDGPAVEELARQAKVYRWATEACLRVGCRSPTVWGFTDRYSWIPGYCRLRCPGWGPATILDADLGNKSVYEEIAATLDGWTRPATDPIAWWRLDDRAGVHATDVSAHATDLVGAHGHRATDFSGHGHHATATVGALATQERLPGRFAFAGDGLGSGAATTSAVVATDRSYTISAWVQLSNRTRSQLIASQDGGFALGYDTAQDRWHFTAEGHRPVISKGVPQLAVWTHLAAVWNQGGGGLLLLYVNGALDNTIQPTTQPSASDGPFRIGRSVAGDHLAGRISDVRAYDRAVTDTEIAAIADPAVGRWTLDGHTGDETWTRPRRLPPPRIRGLERRHTGGDSGRRRDRHRHPRRPGDLHRPLLQRLSVGETHRQTPPTG